MSDGGSMHWLGWIRFFEAAARHGSFVRAAEELHLTHGAVSRQIRQLEEVLGAPLFVRRNRAVFLTDAGRTLQAAASQSMDLLAAAAERIRAAGHRQRALVLSCEPTIAMRWLIPRLPLLAAAHPDIEVHLLAAGGPIDFARSGADLALRRNDFPIDGRLHVATVAPEWVGPVCRPDLAAGLEGGIDGGGPPPARLHTRTRPDAWAAWGRASGRSPRLGAEAWYEHFYLSLQAASAGLGCALASRLMAADELADHRLAAPLGFVQDGSAYCLLSPSPIEEDPRRAALLAWLRTQALACLPAGAAQAE